MQVALLLRRADLVVAVSGAELSLIDSIHEPKRHAVAWPGVEPVDQMLQDHTGGTRPLVLYAGRLSTSKGIEETLKAVAALDIMCDVRVVGEGPAQALAARVCDEVGLSPAEVMLGPLDDDELDRLYSRAELFVSASTQESFGIAVVKAVANGCRIVVSDIPSHREIVERVGLDSRCLVPVPVSVRQLADSIQESLNAPPPPRSVAEAVPSWHDSAREIAAAYEDLLS
jgi:glycosyltransferase involved in cell wall biosynthesis